MDETFFQYPGQILREDRLGVFTQSPFLPVHFHWTTTFCRVRSSLSTCRKQGMTATDALTCLFQGKHPPFMEKRLAQGAE